MSTPNSQETNEILENQVLAGLPSDVFERLLPQLERVVLPPFEILYDFDDEVTHVYFPNFNSVVSMLCRTDEQVNVEVGLCGNEGAVGLNPLFGITTSPFQHLVQVPGTGSRLTIEAASQEFRLGGAFQEALLRFTQSVLVQTSQTALCNRIHSDEERLARWLLLSDDRIETNQLPLPRELLAKMLGRNHSGVSVAASSLERAGLIAYNGAELVILDREKLETVTCSCYWVVKRHTQAQKQTMKKQS